MSASNIEPYLRQVLAYLQKRGVSKQDAEDITQDVAMKYLENQHKVEQGKERAWLFRVALNKRCDLIRKNSVQTRYVLTQGATELQNAPMDFVLSKEQFEQYAKALNKLKPQYKNLLILKYEYGLKYEELSEQFNMKVTTIKSALYRARKLFMKHYAYQLM